jgi:hypothetical protein
MLGRHQACLWRLAELVIVAVFLVGVSPRAALAAQSWTSAQGQLIREYVDVFRPHGMIAVLISIGQAPGDVVDRFGEEFVHRRSECFADLTAQESPSSLPNFDLGAAAALRLGLGLQQIGDAEVQALGENRVILRFDRVTVQTVSQGELRQTINRKACPEIGRLIDKDPEALKEGSFLLGEVFRARSIVRVNQDKGGGGMFSLSGLRALAARLGLRLRAEAGGDLEVAQVVELSSTEPVPVAFRPAFIRLDPSQPGYRSTEARPNAPSIVPFNPDSEDDRLALSSWIDRNLQRAIGATH